MNTAIRHGVLVLSLSGMIAVGGVAVAAVAAPSALVGSWTMDDGAGTIVIGPDGAVDAPGFQAHLTYVQHDGNVAFEGRTTSGTALACEYVVVLTKRARVAFWHPLFASAPSACPERMLRRASR